MVIGNFIGVGMRCGGATAWTPLSTIGGSLPKRWYDFTDLASITKDGSDLISQVNDKGPDLDHGTATGTLRPKYIANQINGLGVGSFYWDALLNVLTTTQVNYGANYTLFVVCYSDWAIGGIMGPDVTNSLLSHSAGFGVRDATGVFFGSMYYQYGSYFDEPYTSFTVRTTAGVPKYWDRKNLRPWYFGGGSSLGDLILKDIGGWAAYPFKKDIAEILIYDRSLTDAEVLQVQSYIDTKYAFTSFDISGTNRIMFVGNSMSAAFVPPYPIYPHSIFNTLNASNNWIAQRFAEGGWITTQLVVGNPYLNQRTQCPISGNDIIIFWEGTNDIWGGATAIQSEANINTACSGWRALGYKIVVVTILPRSATGSFTEAKRLAANILIRANYAGYADAIADVGADALMGQTGDETNLTYYTADQVHPTVAGYTRLAGIIQTVVNGLI